MTAPGAHRSLWRERRFMTYWSAGTISQLGDRVGELAIPLIAITMLQASAMQVGLLTAALWLPYLGSLVVGSWVDHRRHKRRVLVCADLLRALALATVPAAYLLWHLTLAHLYAVALLLGLGEAFFNTALPSVFVALVSRERYIEANSSISVSRSGSYIAGPALGGWLVQLLTAPFALAADAISFLGSALLLSRIRLQEEVPDAPTEGVLRRAAHGLQFVVRHRYLRSSLAASTTVNFFNFVGTALILLYASRYLTLSAALIGLAFGVGAVGGLVGAVATPRLASRFGAGPIAMVGAVVFPASMAIPVLAGGPVWLRVAVLAAAELVAGFGVMLYDVNLNSIQTAVIPDGMRGRVSGAYSTVNYGIRPLGSVVGGVLGTAIGIRETMVLAAVGGLFCVVWLMFSPIHSVRDVADLAAIDPYTGLPRADDQLEAGRQVPRQRAGSAPNT